MTRLGSAEHAFLGAARRAILGTLDPAGLPRLVPICFVVAEDPNGGHRLLTPIDDKPKIAAGPLALARVRDIRARPDVTVLIERWDEDWSRLAWLRLTGRATLLEPDALPVEAIAALRSKYPQYASHRLEGIDRRSRSPSSAPGAGASCIRIDRALRTVSSNNLRVRPGHRIDREAVEPPTRRYALRSWTK